MRASRSDSQIIRPSQNHRVLILGLDGVPYTLIRQFVSEGLMPHLAQIVHEGRLSQMDTAIPEISSVAWTSFFTGVNPAKHGIYGFVDLKPQSYECYFPNSHDVRAKTLWAILGDHDKRSVVINVPSTYPAQPLNGVLVSGFVALDLAKATYPASLVPFLKQSQYQLDVDATKANESFELFATALLQSLQARERVLWRLLTDEPWSCFIGVITETDRMHHYMWEALEDPRHPYHDFVKSMYRRLDEFIGQVYEWFRGKGLFLLLSDHGFCQIQHEVYLNTWLASEGYLRFAKTPPRSVEDLDVSTRAFALDPGRIYVRTPGGHSEGAASAKGEYEALRAELRSRLLELRINGQPVIRNAFLKEELYHGPLLERAPDLILLSNWGFDLKGALNKPSWIGRSSLTGMHTQDDALLFVNDKGGVQRRPHIMDVAPTVMHALGVPAYGSFDGVALV